MAEEEQHRVDHALDHVRALRRVQQRRERQARQLLARGVGEQPQHRLHADGVQLGVTPAAEAHVDEQLHQLHRAQQQQVEQARLRVLGARRGAAQRVGVGVGEEGGELRVQREGVLPVARGEAQRVALRVSPGRRAHRRSHHAAVPHRDQPATRHSASPP